MKLDRHKWGTVYVSADVVVGDMTQHFQLTCSDGISKKRTAKRTEMVKEAKELIEPEPSPNSI